MSSKLILGAVAIAALALPAFALFSREVTSGPEIGETVTPFHPQHVTGPDGGTDNCPPCTYGNLPAVQVWLNGDSDDNVAAIAGLLNGAVKSPDSKLKVFVIFLNEPGQEAEMATSIQKLADKTGYKDIDMAYVPKDSEYVKDYKIDLKAKNTVFVYKNRKVTAKWVDMNASQKAEKLTAAIKAVNN
ncbi:MAG: hypothetical protein KIT11_00615 [Fimbriimonadaceae bacterium]|nr:hypothetical protein [Fimbriimonadaceae bacterium]QYK55125.1 MAG: hypothetical protein KF733_08920 [Fimbriimonadaceae bacterium]